MSKRVFKDNRDRFSYYYERCNEIALQKGQLFLGFVDENKVKGKTKCKLYCPKTKTYWVSTSVEKHINRPEYCSCKGCSRERVLGKCRIPEDVFTENVIKACLHYNSEFRGWKGGFKGIYSKVIQYCPKHEHIWDTTHAKTLIDRTNTGSGCKYCKKENMLEVSDKRDQYHIEQFFATGKFHPDTKFWRSDRLTSCNARNYWKYECPFCSNDEYVAAGLCSGVFEGFVGGLKDGTLSCRCSSGFRWTKEQKEYKLNQLIKEDNITFISWCGNDRINLYCNSCGMEWSPLYYNVVSGGNRCPNCSRYLCVAGFYPEKSEDKDFLYLIRFHHEEEYFIKIGRSFDLTSRLKDYPSYYEIEVIATIYDTHQKIYDKEFTIHNNLRKQGYHYKPKFAFGGSVKECFTPETLNHPEVISTFNLNKTP